MYFLLPCLCANALFAPPQPSDSMDRFSVAVVESQMQITRLMGDTYMFNTKHGRPDQTLRIVHAVDRDRRFLEFIHNTSPSLPPWRDPFHNQSWFDLRKTVTFKLFSRHAHQRRLSGRDFHNPLYGRCIGWRQPDEIALRYVIGGRRFALIDVFAREQRPCLRLLPESEKWGGLTCRVVIADGGRDRLWICPERGHALVHRVWQPSDKKGMVAEYTCSGFEEVMPKIWLPKTCECVYRPIEGGDSPSSYCLEVEHVAVNDQVPDSLFEPKFLPGTHVFGTSGKLERSIPGGIDLLDLWVAVLLNDYPPIEPAYTGPSDADLVWITIGSVLSVAGLSLWFRSALTSAA